MASEPAQKEAGELAKEGQELLDSDFLADVTLFCGGRVWKLHRLILSKRSEWFKKALCGSFTEAKTGVISLQDEDPGAVDQAIKWIYTQKFPELEEESTLYESSVLLAQVSDFLALEGLLTYVTDNLKKHLKKKVRWFQDAFMRSEVLEEQMSTSDIEGFFKGVQAAMDQNIGWAKDAFLGVIADCHYWMLPDKSFQGMCDQFPEVSNEILKGLTKLTLQGQHMPHFKPTGCAGARCDVKPKDEAWRLENERDKRGFVDSLKGIMEIRKEKLSRTRDHDKIKFLTGAIQFCERNLSEYEPELERYESFYWARLGKRGGTPIAYCNKCAHELEEEN